MGTEIEKKYLLHEDGVDFFTGHFEMLRIFEETVKTSIVAIRNGSRAGVDILQGYLPKTDGLELALALEISGAESAKEYRLRKIGKEYLFTIKGDGTLVRGEVEKDIDAALFNKYWDKTLGKRVEKRRLSTLLREESTIHKFTVGKERKPPGLIEVEIDFYKDRDLIVAEVEFDNVEDANVFPPLGKDITEDKKYKNANLAK